MSLHLTKLSKSSFEQFGLVTRPADYQMVVTGTSMDRGEKSGKLVFFQKDTFDKVLEMDVGESHVIKALWHPKLNQVSSIKRNLQKPV